jgi:hypothetical protein
MIIETQYDIGQEVLHPHAPWTEESHPCPDCKGKLKWIVSRPNGKSTEADCPTCKALGKIKKWRFRPTVTPAQVVGMYLSVGYGGDGEPSWYIRASDKEATYCVKGDEMFTLDNRKEAHTKAIAMTIDARKRFARNQIERTVKGVVKREKLLAEHEAKEPVDWLEATDFGPMLNDWKATNGKA